MMRKILDRIAIKLVLWLVFFSVILTVVTTLGQVYIDYRQDRKKIAASLDSVAWQQVPGVAESVLAGDSETVNSLLVNLVRSTGVAYAAVIVDDKIQWQQGSPLAGRGLSSKYPLLAPLGENPPIGSLEVAADTKPMWHDLTVRFIRIIAGNGIKIFLIAGFTLLMFQYLVTRHLESLAQQIHRLDFSKPSTPLRLDRKSRTDYDELDQVVSGLNTMQERARQAYESLARNEQRLLLFFDSTEEAIIGVDRDRVCTFANDACLRMLGLTDYEDVIGKSLHELFVHSAKKKSTEAGEECLVRRVIDQGQALQCDDGFITIPGGRSLFIALRVYPVFKNGSVSGALLFANDNSEKRKLLRERELLSEAIEQVPVMIMIADADNALQYVNAWVERLTGYSRAELVGGPATFLEDLSATGKEKLAAVETRLKAGKQWEGMLETQSKHGQPLKFFSVISPVFDDRNRMVNTISVSREVSYEVALHNELVHAKKMEAVGRLSSSFAHEFGNPLFGVRSVLRDISDRIALTEEDKSLLELAYQECERMRRMVREFQLVYRESTSLDELQSINRIMVGVLEDAGPLMALHKVSYINKMIEETSEVVASKAKLSLVLKNIVVNAIEAMSSTGGILQIGSALQEDFLVLSIGDGGAGIKKEYQELIFEPFFSTKPVVEGAGLGLSVAYGTMRNLGGMITFASEEGEGTCFNIHIPLA
jgi:PAS domain S-box-containing protein